MTHILCAPVDLHPETEKCLQAMSQPVDIVWLDRNDRYAYWQAIKARWTNMDDLLIIEQDMSFTPEMVTDILLCTKDWCARGYKISTAVNTGCLGFTKFSAELMGMLKPEILESAMRQCTLCHGEYWHLDFHLTETARVAGFWVHDHGQVTHLHEYMPLEKALDVRNMTSQQFRADVSELMRSRGWQGPGVYNSHEHTSECNCVWTD